ncbi:NADH:ubiquinone oxidoreductase subunit [Maritalea mobilis]|uniref:NADH:ubiquinone oxidoreductase subunit n=2 Tax=Maritalea mobilis TaxID=483324 RepID=A0A4R6VV12_9HYPH|nr:NADH:ubiquinone oxidoreductase subunit [Maritalea mobilis]
MLGNETSQIVAIGTDMKQFLAELFIWWHGQTLGTRLHTALHGQFVGEDEAGNRYFKSKKGDRRWVLYNGPAEASRIPSGWHGWMHHRTDITPVDKKYDARSWELPHKPNMTGTAHAYRPKGSMLNDQSRPDVTGDYDAWSPE